VGGTRHPFSIGEVSAVESQPHKSIWYRMCRWFKPDWIFAFMLTASVVLLVLSGLKTDVRPLVPSPLFPKLALLIGATVALSIMATLGAKLDRKHLDDYMFQMVANGAVIGIVTTLFVNMLWEIGSDILPPLTSDDLIAVMIGSWSLGYFFYRWRGLNS
jgi:drug/metabolite transporter (DMT)-like permease